MCIWTYKWLGVRVQRQPEAVGKEIARLIFDSPLTVMAGLTEANPEDR